MIRTKSRAYAVAALMLSLAACNREQASTSASSQSDAAIASASTAPSPVAADAAAPPPAQTAAPVPPATEVQIQKIQSVMIRRPADGPDAIIIHAAGNVVSSGWTGGRLTPVEDQTASERVRVYAFVATSPEAQGGDPMPQSIETEIRIDGISPEIRTVRIVSATNAISTPIVQ